MEFNKKQFSSILEALRASPRGMNVTEVAKVTGMNRATVAKYLEMLFVSGHADMRLFGTSKVYYISQRMPISAFLNFSSDLIIVLDRDSMVLNANDSFFEFTNTRREDVVHKNINHFAFPLKFDPPIDPHIMQAINGYGTTIESYYRKKDRGYYFNVKLIPLVFDEGEKGVTIIFEDITEKKLAEKALRDSNRELERKVRERTLELEKVNEALRESEERYRMLIEKSYDLVYSVRLDGTIAYVSPQIARYGYAPEDVLNHNFFEFIPPTVRDFLANKFMEAAVKGESGPTEFKLWGKDGHEYWAEVTGRTIYDETKKPLSQVGTVRDITERKRAEEALRDSELKFKTLFEGASTAIFIIDVETRTIADCNNYAARLIGRPKEEIIGMHHARLHPSDRAEQCHGNAMLHSPDGRVVNFETETLHKDGRRIPILINSTIMEIGGKRIMMGSYLDITDLKRAEGALRDSEEKFRVVADSSKTGILLIQGDDTIYINQALADMGGYTVDECLKMKFWDVAPPGMKEYIRERGFLRQQGEPGPSRNELKLVKKNGEFVWLDCTAAILQYKGKPAMLLTAMDITERKRIESELKRSEERYRSLVENINDMVWETDEDNRCTYTSPQCREILGYGPGEIIGKTPFDLMVQDEAQRVMGLVKPLLDAHKPFELLDYYVIRKDGSKAFLETNGVPMFDDKGRFIGYRGVNRDITSGRR